MAILNTGTAAGWSSGATDWSRAGGNGYQIAANPAANYGNSAVDVRDEWNGGFVYQLPFGKGKAFLKQGGILNAVVGGWQLSNIWQASSGIPFTPMWGGPNLSFSLAGDWHPNRVCNGAVSNPTIQEWFNPSCFVQAAPGTFGNSARNDLYGPDFWNMNTSLAKSWRLPFLGEEGTLQIRMDAHDVLNHPDFGLPNGSVTPPPTFAGVVSIAATQRSIQLGAKISF